MGRKGGAIPESYYLLHAYFSHPYSTELTCFSDLLENIEESIASDERSNFVIIWMAVIHLSNTLSLKKIIACYLYKIALPKKAYSCKFCSRSMVVSFCFRNRWKWELHVRFHEVLLSRFLWNTFLWWVAPSLGRQIKYSAFFAGRFFCLIHGTIAVILWVQDRPVIFFLLLVFAEILPPKGREREETSSEGWGL